MRARPIFLTALLLLAASAAHAGLLPSELTELSGCKPGQGILCDRFYPIGFSKNGKLAYIHVPADEAVGAYLWSFKIVDLVTDKTVETLASHPEGVGNDEIIDLASLLRVKRPAFEALLRRYKIRPLAEPRLRPFPIRTGKDAIDAALVDEPDPAGPSGAGLRSVSHHLVLTDARGRSKRIGDLNSSESDTMGPLLSPPRILGYLKSPFEPRVVVVLEQTRRGYEGPPNVSSFVLVGAHLGVGFKSHPK